MPKPGTSGFTHQDDAVAPIHTTNPDHTMAHVYGGQPVEDEDRDTVVIGPPAYGSPDVRTLGHSVNPDINASSAPKLDPHFETLTKAQSVYTEDELNAMSKAELYELASNAGLDVHKSMSKNDILDVIADESELEADEDESEEESGSGSTKTEATKAEAAATSQQQGAKTNN